MSDHVLAEACHTAMPRADRANVMLMALVEPSEGTPGQHRVRDVSPGGIRIDSAGDLRPGQRLSVSIGALRAIEATVQWTRAGCAGLRFAQPIDPAAARRKSAAADTARPSAAVPTAGWVGDLRNAYRR